VGTPDVEHIAEVGAQVDTQAQADGSRVIVVKTYALPHAATHQAVSPERYRIREHGPAAFQPYSRVGKLDVRHEVVLT